MKNIIQTILLLCTAICSAMQEQSRLEAQQLLSQASLNIIVQDLDRKRTKQNFIDLAVARLRQDSRASVVCKQDLQLALQQSGVYLLKVSGARDSSRTQEVIVSRQDVLTSFGKCWFDTVR